MKTLLKRKQSRKNEFEEIICPYKKRIVCEFSNKIPRYSEKIIIEKKQKSIKASSKNDEENHKDIENEEFLLKPHLISWVDCIRDHMEKLIKPDVLVEKILSFYEKEYFFLFFLKQFSYFFSRYALMIYDESKNFPYISKEKTEAKLDKNTNPKSIERSLSPIGIFNPDAIEIEE